MIRLGQRLQHARKLKKVTLEQAAKSLRIREEFLAALESGSYEKLPSSAYAIGFVGNYAEFLGLPKNETVAMFRREFDEKRVYPVLPNQFTKTKEFKVKRFHMQQTVGIIAVVVCCIAVYIGFQYRFLFFPPGLDIYEPKDNQTYSSNEITISGKTDPNAIVKINNFVISVDQNGEFSKQIDAFEGKTIVQITAENRFGKKTVVSRHIDIKSSQ
jgi:cytoskeletal protein RodZ